MMMLTLVTASLVPGVVPAQVPAGEVERQVPVVEDVERPDSPRADQAQGNAESQLPQNQPGAAVQQPQVEAPGGVQQPRVGPY
jgi:hypothetical protein